MNMLRPACVVLSTFCTLVAVAWCDESPSSKPPEEKGLIIREAEVRVGFEHLPAGNRLEVPLFDGAVVKALREQQEQLPGGAITWAGYIEGEPGSSVVLSRKGDAVYGTIRTEAGKLYRIQPSSVGRDVQVLQELRPPALPHEGGPEEPDDSDLPRIIPFQICNNDPKIIDLLVVYTEDARKGADTGNTGRPDPIEALIYLAIAQTHQAYLRSDINHRLRLVHVQEVSYVESTYVKTDLMRLQKDADGYLDDVLDLRYDYGADIVALITEKALDSNGKDSCGWSYINNIDDFEDWAFSVVKRSCANPALSFAHETAHLFSARHDWAVDSNDNSPYHYNHGHIKKTPTDPNVAPWRTIMSYDDYCPGCIRIGYYSNPRLTYHGDLLGAPNEPRPTDNSQAINNKAEVVAVYRCETAAPQAAKVWMRDAWIDSGLEPDPATANLPMWRSPYIWVRQTRDDAGMYEHLSQTPVLGTRNWVYVKFHVSDQSAVPGDLELYWADPLLIPAWPTEWSLIARKSYLSFAGEHTLVAEFPWEPTGPGPYALLGRWVSAQDPMTHPEGTSVNTNVRNNNNLILRSVVVVKLAAWAAVRFRIPDQRRPPFAIWIQPSAGDPRPSFLSHGDVRIELDPATANAWRGAGMRGSGITGEGPQLRIGEGGAKLEGFTLSEGQEGFAELQFDRHPATPAGVYLLDVILRDGRDNTGGVTYEIHVPGPETHSDPNAPGDP